MEIGKVINNEENVSGEFIGMIKCTKKGAEIFNKYFHKAKTFDNAYLTDFVQYLVNNGVKVKCVTIERGWVEIDTTQDFKRAPKFLEETM